MSGFSSVVATVVLLAVATGMVVSVNNKEGKTGEVLLTFGEVYFTKTSGKVPNTNWVGNVDHLFLGCVFAGQVWSAVYSWLRFYMVQHNQVRSHLIQHGFLSRGNRFRKVRYLLWHVTCWNIWLHRNRIVFKNARADVRTMLWHIQTISRTWFKYKGACLSGFFFC
ncbi:hypothetical protein JHK87_052166 [Glycine soja]|nr:hypothetical protein JHK87_052166 [Glycine soja]